MTGRGLYNAKMSVWWSLSASERTLSTETRVSEREKASPISGPALPKWPFAEEAFRTYRAQRRTGGRVKMPADEAGEGALLRFPPPNMSVFATPSESPPPPLVLFCLPQAADIWFGLFRLFSRPIRHFSCYHKPFTGCSFVLFSFDCCLPQTTDHQLSAGLLFFFQHSPQIDAYKP